MITKTELDNLEVGKTYLFKVNSRRNKIRAELLNKNSIYTGLSLYHGTDAIEILKRTKRSNITYTLSIYGIETVEQEQKDVKI